MNALNVNPLQVECMMFFQENPYAFETVQGLSLRLGRNPDDLVDTLHQLVEKAILEAIGTGSNAIYRYVQPVVTTTLDIERQEHI